MSRRTRNSRDAVLFPEVNTAVLPEVSVQFSHPAASSNPAISSVASPLTAAQLSPRLLGYDCTGGESFHGGRPNSCFARNRLRCLQV